MNKYKIIYADPPWQFKDKLKNGERGAESKYPCMSIKELSKLPVESLADDNCLLAMWWVGAMPESALFVAKSWGFKLKTMTGFTWAKQTKHGDGWAFGMGHWTRGNSESCLFAVRGKPKRVDAGIRQLVCSPRLSHSEKPDVFRQHLVRLMGDVPRIELFARVRNPGWDAWGNEVQCNVALSYNKPAFTYERQRIDRPAGRL